MGSISSKDRTSIHVVRVEETTLEVQGRRLSPKKKGGGTGGAGGRAVGEPSGNGGGQHNGESEAAANTMKKHDK